MILAQFGPTNTAVRVHLLSSHRSRNVEMDGNSCHFVLLSIRGGDGRKGYEAGQPFDAIHVGAAAAEMPPAVS